MFRNMVTSLFKYERIRTTDAKAKELRSWADHMITLAKRGDLHARRQVLAVMREKDVAHKLFEEASERFGNISGGYTRIVKLGKRPGDAASVSLIELLAIEKSRKKKLEKKKKEAAKAVAAKADEKDQTAAEQTDSATAAAEDAEK
jgi:large subunit ribosomal protein L17